MSKRILFITSFIFLSLALLLSNIPLAYGQGIIPKATGKSTSAGCAERAPAGVDPATYCGNYAIDDFLVLAVNIASWILGIVGSLCLVMFVYGGFMFLISTGSSESITKARKIIVAAVIGLIIVLSSYLIIKFALSTIGIDWNGKKIKFVNVTISDVLA